MDLNEIIQYIKKHTFHYKTDKSIYNILIGAKTHQTYFDACSQQLLSLYHSQPDLKYTSFERIYHQNHEAIASIPLKVSTRYTFESIQQTFQVLQLLVQTISFKQHHTLSFIPVSEISKVQKRVKKIYFELETHQHFQSFKTEIYQLFELLNQAQPHSILHYFLQGYDEVMYTNQQVSLIENLNISELAIIKMNDLVEMIHLIEDKTTFPILNQAIILPTLSINTKDTLKLVHSGSSLERIAHQEGVKVNTIEDHIIELYIKGYFTDYSLYLDSEKLNEFKAYYLGRQEERLRNFKAAFPDMSYFEIKLAITKLAREGV
ncbi:helix-turn-helix domain-containing protein [Staphylococcus simulans]